MGLHLEHHRDASSIHRPYLVHWFESWHYWGLCLEWGDRNSDPVWSIGISRR